MATLRQIIGIGGTAQERPDPEALYEVVESFSAGNGVYATGALVRGADPIVTDHFALFMPAALDDLQKRAVRREYWNRSYATAKADAPKVAPPPVAGPPSGKFRSVRSWTIPDPDLQDRAILNAGTVVDASDPTYLRYPHLFVQDVEER